MKRRTAAITVVIVTALITVLVYYVASMVWFTHKIRNTFPELKEQPTILFIPWPFGPTWISHIRANHPLYSQREGEFGGTIRRERYQVTVMASDGTVVAEGVEE